MTTFGTPAHMLARRDSPSTSRAAAKALDTTRLEALVFDFIKSSGPAGCIADDVLSGFPLLPYSSVTARFASLARKGLIACGPQKRTGKSGRGQRVMSAA